MMVKTYSVFTKGQSLWWEGFVEQVGFQLREKE